MAHKAPDAESFAPAHMPQNTGCLHLKGRVRGTQLIAQMLAGQLFFAELGPILVHLRGTRELEAC